MSSQWEGGENRVAPRYNTHSFCLNWLHISLASRWCRLYNDAAIACPYNLHPDRGGEGYCCEDHTDGHIPVGMIALA